MLTVFIWAVVSKDCWLRRVNSEAHSLSELGEANISEHSVSGGHARGAFSVWFDAMGSYFPES